MGYSPVGLAARSASSCCATHSVAMNGLAASRPSATTASVGAPAPPAIRSMTLSVASASTIMMATSSAVLRPATTMSKTAFSSCSTVADATDGAGERYPRDLRGRRRGVDRQHVVQILGVEAQDGDDDLDLVTQARDEGGPQRPVDQSARQDRVGGGATLTPEERAGDASRRIHALFDVDGQREEVEMVFGGLAGRGGRQQHGLVVEVGDDGAGGLLGQPAGLETDGAGAEAPVVDNGGRFEHAFFNFNYRHRRPYGLSGSLFNCFASSQRLDPGPGSGRRSKLSGVRTPAATTEDRAIRRIPI